jgi:hypothetical protein
MLTSETKDGFLYPGFHWRGGEPPDGPVDMVMIKDHHIAAAGGIEAAVEGVRDYLRRNSLDMGVAIRFFGFR